MANKCEMANNHEMVFKACLPLLSKTIQTSNPCDIPTKLDLESDEVKKYFSKTFLNKKNCKDFLSGVSNCLNDEPLFEPDSLTKEYEKQVFIYILLMFQWLANLTINKDSAK